MPTAGDQVWSSYAAWRLLRCCCLWGRALFLFWPAPAVRVSVNTVPLDTDHPGLFPMGSGASCCEVEILHPEAGLSHWGKSCSTAQESGVGTSAGGGSRWSSCLVPGCGNHCPRASSSGSDGSPRTEEPLDLVLLAMSSWNTAPETWGHLCTFFPARGWGRTSVILSGGEVTKGAGRAWLRCHSSVLFLLRCSPCYGAVISPFAVCTTPLGQSLET